MNILFISHYFPPEVNAPATRTHAHCSRWVIQGHNVCVVTGNPNCPTGIVYAGYTNKWLQKEIIDNIEVLRVWTFLAPNKGSIKRILNYLSFMFSACIHSLFLKKKFDVIIATSPQFFCGWAGVILHLITKIPFILEIRDIWPDSIVAVGAMQRKNILVRCLEYCEKIMYDCAAHIVTVGEGYKEKIVAKRVAPEKISVVTNGVDIEHFICHPQTRENAKSKYHGEGKFVCSYIGTIGMAHGLQVILSAAEQLLKAKRSDIIFWIVGDGAEKEDLEKQAQLKNLTNILFTGRIEKKEIPGIIAATDAAVVHLRKTDCFASVIPSKIFEYLAMNIPIIMGVRGEALRIVLDAHCGVEMQPEDPYSLISCIDMVKNQTVTKTSGREYVKQKFNRDALALDMLRIVEHYSQKRTIS